MDRRIETRVIDTGGAALTTIIQKDACEVWWITVSGIQAVACVIKIYDGFDAHGKLQWQCEPIGEAVTHNFIPPIPCDQGIFVYNDGDIKCYTIAFRPKSWRKES